MVEQNIEISGLLEFVSIIFTIIISTIIIARFIKKGYQNYIDNKINILDMKVTNIEKDIIENERHNAKEHDDIKESIDEKLDLIIKLIESKSA